MRILIGGTALLTFALILLLIIAWAFNLKLFFDTWAVIFFLITLALQIIIYKFNQKHIGADLDDPTLFGTDKLLKDKK